AGPLMGDALVPVAAQAADRQPQDRRRKSRLIAAGQEAKHGPRERDQAALRRVTRKLGKSDGRFAPAEKPRLLKPAKGLLQMLAADAPHQLAQLAQVVAFRDAFPFLAAADLHFVTGEPHAHVEVFEQAFSVRIPALKD